MPRVEPDVDVIAIGASPGDAAAAGRHAIRRALSDEPRLDGGVDSARRPQRRGSTSFTRPPTPRRSGACTRRSSRSTTSATSGAGVERVQERPGAALFYRRSALAADRVITDSEFSRSEITAAYGIPAERIDVVPLAAAELFTPGPFDPSRLPGRRHASRTRCTSAICTSGATSQPRSPRSCAALGIGARRSGPGTHRRPLTFVCAGVDRGIGADLAAQGGCRGRSGCAGSHRAGERRRAGQSLPRRGDAPLSVALRRVRAAGPRSDAVRRARHRRQRLVAPGARGRRRLLLDPLDVAAWTDAIRRLLTDRAMAARLREAGLARAAGYSWAGRRTTPSPCCASAPRSPDSGAMTVIAPSPFEHRFRQPASRLSPGSAASRQRDAVQHAGVQGEGPAGVQQIVCVWKKCRDVGARTAAAGFPSVTVRPFRSS